MLPRLVTLAFGWLGVALAQTPTASPAIVLIQNSRHTIDTNNLTFALTSDASQVSVGALDVFGDGIGSAVSTAVMFQTPAGSTGLPWQLVRIDLLFYKVGGQTRDLLNDFYVSLYADDGTAEHNPGVMLSSAPYSLSSFTVPLLTFRAVWYHVPVSFWPPINASSNFWIVISPGDPTKLKLGAANNGYSFNGIIWAGFDLAEYFEKKQSNPGYVANDNTGGNLFTGRELRSARFANDTQFAANTAGGVNYVMNTQNWGSVASSQYGSVRYKNWKAVSSNVKYGLAIYAWQAPTTPTSTSSATATASASLTATSTSTRTSTRTSTSSFTSSSTRTSSSTNTASATSSGTRTSSATSSSSSVSTASSSPTSSSSLTSSGTTTSTTSATSSATPSASQTMTSTATSSSTSSSSSTATSTGTPTSTSSGSSTRSSPGTASSTSSGSSTATSTGTSSSTSTSSATRTSSSSSTLTATPSTSRSGTPSTSLTQTQTPSRTPLKTTLTTTRFWIDRFNQTFARESEATVVSVGAQQPPFADPFGTLVTTAVMVKMPTNPAGFPQLLYRPDRLDLLLFTPDLQPTRPGISDFCTTLYSDDGSEEHNPGVQLSTPFLMNQAAGQTPLSSTRAAWYPIDISTAGWPLLSADTYYWVAVTPCSPLAMTTQNGRMYNGAVWAGAGDSSIFPPFIDSDPNLFTARQIISERFAGDSTFGANTVAAVNKNRNALAWGQFSPPEYRNWAAPPNTENATRYGIQLLGWQQFPPATVSSTPSQLPSWSISPTGSTTSTASRSASPSMSVLPTRSQTVTPSKSPSQASTSSQSPSQAGTPSQTATPYPTTITTSRDSIDTNNYTSVRSTDAAQNSVSVGAQDPFLTGTGTLVSTGVLVKTHVLPSGYPDNTGYIPTRVDILMFVRAIIPARSSISDFFVTLYSDDGSSEHNPALQLSAPYSMSIQTALLQVQRGVWFEQDITLAGWPVLVPNTYYWVVVTPGQPLPLPAAGTVDGAIWGGINDLTENLPVQAIGDQNIFKGRQLISATGASDTAFGSAQAASVSFLQTSPNWPNVPSAPTRFTNWDLAGSRVRYGVQITGFFGPFPSVSPSSSATPTISVSSTGTPTSSISLSSTRSVSPSQSSTQTTTVTNTPFPTKISDNRFPIDKNNLLFQLATDATNVSSGAWNEYSDPGGNLVGTAVLIKTSLKRSSDTVDWIYRPSRVDFLLAAPNASTSDQLQPTSLVVTLYADDNSTGAHTPGIQLAAPFQITVSGPRLLSNKGQWYQQDISTAGWPLLLGTTYYWVALTPAAPVSMSNGRYNGVRWVGYLDTTPNVNPIGQYTGDFDVFKARQLKSQRNAADSAFYANTQAAVNFLTSQQQWSTVPFANTRYADFDAAGSRVRYGIQLTGFQVSPSPSPSKSVSSTSTVTASTTRSASTTSTSTASGTRTVTASATLSATSTLTASRSMSPTPSVSLTSTSTTSASLSSTPSLATTLVSTSGSLSISSSPSSSLSSSNTASASPSTSISMSVSSSASSSTALDETPATSSMSNTNAPLVSTTETVTATSTRSSTPFVSNSSVHTNTATRTSTRSETATVLISLQTSTANSDASASSSATLSATSDVSASSSATFTATLDLSASSSVTFSATSYGSASSTATSTAISNVTSSASTTSASVSSSASSSQTTSQSISSSVSSSVISTVTSSSSATRTTTGTRTRTAASSQSVSPSVSLTSTATVGTSSSQTSTPQPSFGSSSVLVALIIASQAPSVDSLLTTVIPPMINGLAQVAGVDPSLVYLLLIEDIATDNTSYLTPPTSTPLPRRRLAGNTPGSQGYSAGFVVGTPSGGSVTTASVTSNVNAAFEPGGSAETAFAPARQAAQAFPPVPGASTTILLNGVVQPPPPPNTAGSSQANNSPQPNNGAIAGGVVGGIVFLVIVVVIAIVVANRLTKKGKRHADAAKLVAPAGSEHAASSQSPPTSASAYANAADVEVAVSSIYV